MCHMAKVQHMQPQERALHYEIPYRPREVVSADIFNVNNKTLLCIVGCYKQIPNYKESRLSVSR